ncbi:MAG: solute:sodium symporter family transporter [Planctomycetia bacterium]|nr:solute:sodium symporter family transporter [Planctomycetia bacterium]
MDHIITVSSFFFFTALVAFLTWLMTRKEDMRSAEGFFLAGRSLTFPFIAGSLLLTNLSTEQMVGLNGDAFSVGLSVMAWEIIPVLALVTMALYFLPKFLKSGITTIPELLEIRFDSTSRLLVNIYFLVAYTTILLPIVLYTGAQGLMGILDLKALTGIQSETALLWLTVWGVGLLGSCYALFGGLRSVAVSDTLTGVGFLVGCFLITFFGLSLIGGEDGILSSFAKLRATVPEHLNSIGGAESKVPFGTIFTGVIVMNMFYWCTNQQIIQRTLAANSLAEGQKGVLLCGALKLLGPLFLVLPGIMAYYLFVATAPEGTPQPRSVEAYGMLVRTVLPTYLTGFFAAVMVGAILSSFNSILNSTCTLFSLGIYRKCLRPDANDVKLVRVSRNFGWLIAIIAMCIAPQLAQIDSIFTFLKTMNGLYTIPVFAVVLMGLLVRRIPAGAARFALIFGPSVIAFMYFIAPGTRFDLVKIMGGFHFLGIVFATLIVSMFVWSLISPRREGTWVQKDAQAVDLTPWRYAVPAGVALVLVVVTIYAVFADFSVLK